MKADFGVSECVLVRMYHNVLRSVTMARRKPGEDVEQVVWGAAGAALGAREIALFAMNQNQNYFFRMDIRINAKSLFSSVEEGFDLQLLDAAFVGEAEVMAVDSLLSSMVAIFHG